MLFSFLSFLLLPAPAPLTLVPPPPWSWWGLTCNLTEKWAERRPRQDAFCAGASQAARPPPPTALCHTAHTNRATRAGFSGITVLYQPCAGQRRATERWADGTCTKEPGGSQGIGHVNGPWRWTDPSSKGCPLALVIGMLAVYVASAAEWGTPTGPVGRMGRWRE